MFNLWNNSITKVKLWTLMPGSTILETRANSIRPAVFREGETQTLPAIVECGESADVIIEGDSVPIPTINALSRALGASPDQIREASWYLAMIGSAVPNSEFDEEETRHSGESETEGEAK